MIPKPVPPLISRRRQPLFSSRRRPLAATAVASLAAVAALAPVGAAAQLSIWPNSCVERAKMVAKLLNDYGETRRGAGLQSETGVLELFVAESGTWTLLLTRPNGETCPVAVGEAWRDDDELPADLDKKPV